jgi:transcriptional regulator with XRE-family HTH domain
MKDQKKWRFARKYNLEALSRLTGLSMPKLNRFETGRYVPDEKERIVISKALAVPLKNIFWKGDQVMDAPRMPRMLWNKDGSPDFSHLLEDEEEREDAIQQELVMNLQQKRKDGSGVPDMPIPKFDLKGKPIFEEE